MLQTTRVARQRGTARRLATETIGTDDRKLRSGRMTNERIVAIGLLTQEELTRLGPAFRRAWPIDEAPCFEGLLEAIDVADRRIWRDRDRGAAPEAE